MSLPNDVSRCTGGNCPSKLNCQRYTDKGTSPAICYAAFYARRDAGADCCDSMIPVRAVTTYVANV